MHVLEKLECAVVPMNDRTREDNFLPRPGRTGGELRQIADKRAYSIPGTSVKGLLHKRRSKPANLESKGVRDSVPHQFRF